jgi:hypothetical protein
MHETAVPSLEYANMPSDNHPEAHLTTFRICRTSGQ